MAKLEGGIPFKGRWGGLTFYPLPGVGTVGRQYWGPTSKDVATKPQYDITRRNNTEHGACSTASKHLRRNFRPLEPARDYSMSAPVTGWLKDLLPEDSLSEFGKRHILLSQAPHLLEGINLSRRYPFDSVVRGGVSCTLSRETLNATVQLPPLRAGVSFTPVGKHPYFKVVASLGVAPDVLWLEDHYGFAQEYGDFRPFAIHGAWTPTAIGTDAMTLDLQLACTPPDPHFALVLTLGIIMGTIGRRGQVEAVKYGGCGKVVAAG